MNEQQRLFLAMTCCMAIWLGWMVLTGGPERTAPVAAAPSVPTFAAPAYSDASRAAGQAEAALTPRGAGTDAATPTLPSERRAFATAALLGEVQNIDGALASLTLPAFAPRVLEQDDGETAAGVALLPHPAGATAPPLRQAALQFRLASGPVALHFAAADGLALAGEAADGTKVRVQLRPDPERYAIDYAVEIDNATPQPQQIAAGLTLGLAPLGELEPAEKAPPSLWQRVFGAGTARGTDRLRGLVAHAQKIERKDFAAAKRAPYAPQQQPAWAAIDEQYFLLAWLPQNDAPARAELFTRDDTLALHIGYAGERVAPGGRWSTQFRVFAGPKRDHELAAVDRRLVDSIDYNFLGIPLGFLARPMVYLLRYFHGATASWGLSILLLTLVVKLAMLPVAYKSVASIKRLTEVRPELDRIKERYAGDTERLNAEQMKLFKERGVNPVGGCLPMLLQIPVWLTLYRTLWGAVDLYRQPFLWLTDLTAREPIPYLALVLGAVTYLQQKMTPVAMDNQQARIMAVMMPCVVSLFMFNMPSGLGVYMVANSVLTIVQQLAIQRFAGTPTKA